MTDQLRPLPQTVAGIIDQPGYVDTDFFFLATVLERLGEEWVDAPKILTPEQFDEVQEVIAGLHLPEDYRLYNDSTFAAVVAAAVELLPEEVWAKLHLDRESWEKSLKSHRNLIAHSAKQGGPHRRFSTGLPLRALRDATAVVVTLLFAQHLGVDGDALSCAADGQRVQRIMKHKTGTLVFNNSGLE
ncbi:hypothetical protein [Leucobacter luti]|uniref:hypothetical protein n=1 Tax=Leucobacter luti TaxID=340320 RepID=UPI001C690FB6|nr:hypothetical protein [Leucobacter luti]QYM75603.1 hypothetical protein K1X41_13430 [Leucobacter luti]